MLIHENTISTLHSYFNQLSLKWPVLKYKFDDVSYENSEILGLQNLNKYHNIVLIILWSFGGHFLFIVVRHNTLFNHQNDQKRPKMSKNDND